MGTSKPRACGECSERCLLAHHDQGTSKNPSSVVPSFFKPLIAESWLTTLVIPPAFSKTIMSLTGQQIDLEDAKGCHWLVELSSDGSQLLLGQGWSQFSLDHSLEVGDLLVFYHIMRSNFIVKIYGRRDCCEKLNFSKKSSGNARRRSTAETLFDHIMEDGERSAPLETPTPMTDKSWDNELVCYSSIHSDINDNIVQRESNPQIADKICMSIENEAPFREGAVISKSVMDNDPKEVPSNSSVHSDSNENIVQSENNVPTVEKIPKRIENEAPFNDGAVIPEPVMCNDCMEVPFYMIERDLADVQEVNRSCLLDLSDFEMVNSLPGTDKIVKRPVEKNDGMLPHLVQPGTKRKADCVENLCSNSRKWLLDTARERKGAHMNFDFEGTQKRCRPRVIETESLPEDNIPKDNHTSSLPEKYAHESSTPRRLQTDANNGRDKKSTVNPERSNEILKKCILPEKQKSMFSGMDLVSQVKSNSLSGTRGCVLHRGKVLPRCGNDPIMTKTSSLSGKSFNVVKDEQHFDKSDEQQGGEQCLTGSKLRDIKAEPQEMVNYSMKFQGQASKLVKTENVDFIDLPYLSGDTASSSAYVVTQSYLELPRNLPTIFGGGRLRNDRKLVVIRDPAMRLWPVIYHEKTGLRVLTTRWEALAKTNNIQDGDQCFFEVEDQVENIFRVRIVKK